MNQAWLSSTDNPKGAGGETWNIKLIANLFLILIWSEAAYVQVLENRRGYYNGRNKPQKMQVESKITWSCDIQNERYVDVMNLYN